MTELSPQNLSLFSLAERTIRNGESIETLARDNGVPETELRRYVRAYGRGMRTERKDRQKEDLIPGLIRMAPNFHLGGHRLEGRPQYTFKFPEIKQGTGAGQIKSYTPDVVWFSEEPSDVTATVIFEIDDGTSPKHQMGGLAFANILALKLDKPMWVFAIVPAGSRIASKSMALLERYLGPKWVLRATEVQGFELSSVEESVRKVLRYSL